MKRACLRAGAVCMLFLAAVSPVAADGGFSRNEITVFPSGGVSVAGGFVETGFVGLGISYTRFLGKRFGIGLKPFVSVNGLGTADAEPVLDLELFTEFRPLLRLHSLYAQAYLKSLWFTSGSSQPLAFRRVVGGTRIGFDVPLSTMVGLSIGAGAEITATPSGATVQPTLTIGLSFSF